MHKTIQTQVIILGGGLVGLTMANLCAKHGFQVALVENKEPDFSKGLTDQKFDIRCSAITPNSENVFRQLEIWDTMQNDRISPYQKMIVWDGAGFGEISFDAKEIDKDHLGHIIENKVMHKALWEKAKAESGIQLFCPCQVIDLEYETENDQAKQIVLKIRTQGTEKHVQKSTSADEGDVIHLKAELIIGADGARSWLRDKANIAYTHKSYHQEAIAATVRHEKPHEKTAWQRFLPEGPLAFLPLSEPHTSSIVWTSTPEKTVDHLAMPEEAFCKALAYALDYRLGKIETVYERLSFPLSKLHAKAYIKNRVALIGDAAHVIHPLAGQGFNLGILDAAALLEVLIYGRDNRCDLGQPQLLRRYERARMGHNVQMSLIMDFFKNLYSTTGTIGLGLRGLGLNFINHTQFIKKKIMQYAV